MVNVDNGNVMVNNAKVIKTDVVCSNGIIHWVDTVILP
jgi:transforming growth factor-beta-induced protein